MKLVDNAGWILVGCVFAVIGVLFTFACIIDFIQQEIRKRENRPSKYILNMTENQYKEYKFECIEETDKGITVYWSKSKEE